MGTFRNGGLPMFDDCEAVISEVRCQDGKIGASSVLRPV